MIRIGEVLAGLGMAAALAGAAEATPPELSEADQIALGQALTARNCGMCHATGPTGVSASPQAPPFRQLNQHMDVDRLGEGLATGILTGHPAMPEFRFEPYEVISIIKYLKSIQAKTRT